MDEKYTYTLAQCDVPIERHSVLQSYRDKRQLWLSWISTDASCDLDGSVLHGVEGCCL
jgi:hypothetical protein